ncbi:MAG: hypothetical protein RL757_31 [Bacteroidota bacterium]|jgi:cysteinyl-tRNA synthetase
MSTTIESEKPASVLRPFAKDLQVYNSLKREKMPFKPISEDFVGMYVCGPTVYSDVHLGNCRTFINFDLIFRYLQYLGYRVRYVRNVTDVGHLEGDADTDANDKMLEAARRHRLEPMEVAQRYTVGFHEMMRIFNVLPPSIEPRATGHIPEQIEMVEKIIKRGFAYQANGSVYFDTLKFANESGDYGKLSGRILEDLLTESRENLKKQEEKRHPSDFAIWIKAAPSHLMRWTAPWSVGFPGWHLECSAMSTKYLGETFDIHGGGFDLKFPHHENEIAQNYGACGGHGARYWLHGNMLLLNGKKMSKSDGNNLMPQELFSGNSPHLTKGYSPMVIRFFMLQAHYASTLDLTDSGLAAAEKAYKRLMEGYQTIVSLAQSRENGADTGGESNFDITFQKNIDAVFSELNDDFHAPKAMAKLFDLLSKINGLKAGKIPMEQVSKSTLNAVKHVFEAVIFDIFGLKDETHEANLAAENSNDHKPDALDGAMQLIIEMRKTARENKDFATSDKIRNAMQAAGIQLKDTKDGTEWSRA